MDAEWQSDLLLLQLQFVTWNVTEHFSFYFNKKKSHKGSHLQSSFSPNITEQFWQDTKVYFLVLVTQHGPGWQEVRAHRRSLFLASLAVIIGSFLASDIALTVSRCFHWQTQSSISVGKRLPLCKVGNWGLPSEHSLISIFTTQWYISKSGGRFGNVSTWMILSFRNSLTMRIATIITSFVHVFREFAFSQCNAKRFWQRLEMSYLFEASQSHQMKAKE